MTNPPTTQWQVTLASLDRLSPYLCGFGYCLSDFRAKEFYIYRDLFRHAAEVQNNVHKLSLNHCSVRLSGFASSIQGFLLHQPPGNRVIIDTIRQVLLKTVWYITTSLARAAFWRRVEALVIRHFAFNGNRSGCSIVSIPTSTSSSGQ